MDIPDRDYAEEAEAVATERRRRTQMVRKRLKEAGLHLYPAAISDAMVRLIEDECVVTRKRIGIILDQSREHFEGSMNDVQLERMAFVVLCHESHGGDIRMPLDLIDEDEESGSETDQH